MNYELSAKILDEVKKAEKILVNCHRSPDADAVGSALAVYRVLADMGKDVHLVSPDEVPLEMAFLPEVVKVEKIDFSRFDFAQFDLFLVLDSASVGMITGRKDIAKPKIPTVVIDHHYTNELFGAINLVDAKVSSTAELLYSVFGDWGIKIDKEIAQDLLTGIIADTGTFQYPGVTAKTLDIAQQLMRLGADKDVIIFNVFHSYAFNKIKFWGELINRMELDEKYRFVWSAVPHAIYAKYQSPKSAKESAASTFAQSVEGTRFGILMVEEEPGILSLSLRSRGTEFDVSKIALKLGGGGHKGAAGGKIAFKDFTQAVNEVLDVAREVVDENKG